MIGSVRYAAFLKNLVVVGCFLAGCRPPQAAPRDTEQVEVVSVTSALSTAMDRTFTMPLPAGVARNDVALAGKAFRGVQIDDRVRVTALTPGRLVQLASATGTVNLGADARLEGDMISQGTGTASIGNRSVVVGNVTTAQDLFLGQGATVSGTVRSNFNLGAATSFSVSTVFPAGICNNIVLEPGNTSTAAPGCFRNMTVKTGSRLTLTAGTYHVDDFDIEPNADLILNKSAGPITIFVKNSLIFRGTFQHGGGKTGDLLIVFAGTSASFEGPLRGTLLAPNARVNLASVGGHSGAVFADSVTVHQGTVFSFDPFSWSAIPRDCGNRVVAEDGVCLNPMIFVPGVMGTRLKKVSTGEELWIGCLLTDHSQLTLNPSDPQVPIVAGDIIRTVNCPSSNEKKGLIALGYAIGSAVLGSSFGIPSAVATDYLLDRYAGLAIFTARRST